MKETKFIAKILIIIMTLSIITQNNLQQVFAESSDFGYYTMQENGETELIISEYRGTDLNVVIPDEIDGYKVKQIGYGVFNGKNLKSVVLPQYLEIIHGYAFANNSLKEVILPEHTTMIQHHAFENNIIIDLTLSSSLETIYEQAFYNNQITKVIMPDSIKLLGTNAFRENQINTLVLSKNLTQIEPFTFYSNKISELVIPDSIKVISGYAFTNNQIVTLDLPSELLEIGDYAFSNNLIEHVDISDSIVSLGHGAFGENKISSPIVIRPNVTYGSGVFMSNNISEITILDGVKIIPNSFIPFNNITTLNLPDSIESIGSYAFSQNKINNTITLKGNIEYADNVFSNNEISEVIISPDVTEISDFTFYYNNISQVFFSEELTTIGKHAFAFNNITNLELPANVTGIGESAFTYNAIQYVKLNDALEVIPPNLFSNNQLYFIEFPPNLKTIGNQAFSNNNLISVIMGDQLTKIGSSAFSNNKISNITFNENLKEIDDYAFYRNSIKKIQFPGSVIRIGALSFSNNLLESVLLPDNLTSLGIGAFSGNRLTSIQIPQNITVVEQSVFAGNMLSEVVLSDKTTRINDSAFYNNQIQSVVFPNTVTYIGNGAFDRNMIQEVVFPQNLRSIGNSAFSNNQIVELNIPDAVTYIGNNAFSHNRISVLKLPFGLETINYETFRYNNLSNIQLPSKLRVIGDLAFASNALNKIYFPSKLLIIGNESFKNNNLSIVSLPDSIISIGNEAFYNYYPDTYSLSIYGTKGSVSETYANDNFHTFVEREIVSLEIQALPSKTKYVVGEKLDLTGMEIIGTYNDESTELVNITMTNISGYDSGLPAVGQLVTVTVDGKTVTFTVDIIPKELESIEITKEPSDLEYVVGQQIDLTGMEVTGTYNDESTEIQSITMSNVSGFDSSEPASEQIVTVSVDGKTATFTVDIIAKVLESIEITKKPTDLEYVVGQEINLGGLEVTGTFNDGTTQLFVINMAEISGFDSSEPANGQVVTVTVEGKTASFEVDIIAKALKSIEITNEPEDLEYVVGQTLSLKGLVVEGTYNDETTKLLSITMSEISGFDSSEAEVGQVVTVTVEGKTATFAVDIIAKALVSIEINKLPSDLEYVVGQGLDLTGLEVMGTYNDESTALVDITISNISGFDSSEPEADQVILIIYEGRVLTFRVDIIAKALTSIEITKEPADLEYVVGQSLDLTGLEVTGTYNDNSIEILEIIETDISGFDSSEPASGQIVTVSVDGKTATFTVDIIAKALASIEITKEPADLEYVVGQSLDPTGLEVTGTYNDNSTEILEIIATNISGFDSSEPEVDQVVTVTVEGKKATFTVDIIARALASIEITKEPIDLEYVVGQSFDPTGLEVTGFYNDETSQKIDITKVEISGFDSSEPEVDQVLTVTVDGKTATFTVDIIAKALASLEITKKPADLEYVVGQALDLTGLEVTGFYNDETIQKIDITKVEISGFDSSKPEVDQVLTVTVEGKTATFTVDIIAKALASIEITKEPADLEYVVGQSLDLTGLVVMGTYNDKSTEILEINMTNISGFDSSITTVDQVVSVTVDGKTVTFTVDIIAKVLVSIEISKAPIKTVYYVGQTPDFSGMEIMGTYNDESTELLEMINADISGFDSASPAAGQVITVTYGQFNDTFTVDILENKLEKIEVTNLPEKLEYYEGEELDLTGFVVTGTYSDGIKKTLNIDEKNISGFDSSTSTSGQILTVTVEGKSDSFTIDILKNTLENIEIINLPVKLTYYEGEALDITGMTVMGTYINGTKKLVEINETNISGFDSSKAVDGQSLTVTIEGKSDTFSVNIIKNTLVSIEITRLPAKLEYVQGEVLDISDLEVTGTYLKGNKVILTVTDTDVSGFDSSIPADGQTLTVTIEGITESFSIDIIAKVLVDVSMITPPAKLIYQVGEDFDLTGLELLGEYNDGNSNNLDLAEVTVHGFDSSAPAEKQLVTLTIEKWTFEHTVDVINSPAVDILAGPNRYRTAVAISQASYVQSDVVILVQGNNFPDALAAGPLAYMMNAPILLTSTTQLSSSVKEEMQRLQAKKVIIMGGYTAVSENVEDILKSEGYTVERLEGSNRYATAIGTAQYMAEKLGRRNTVVLASGNQFADALAAGSYAAKEGYPILLTDGIRLTKTTMDHITESGVENIILVGGTSVISEALESELKAMGITITRKSGKNRFDTSLDIARSYFENAVTAVVANGMEFADALAAAPYAAKMNAPIILVNQTRINQPIKDYLPMSKINRMVVVGGDAAISEAVRTELMELIE